MSTLERAIRDFRCINRAIRGWMIGSAQASPMA
jgi:hypothetical protein